LCSVEVEEKKQIMATTHLGKNMQKQWKEETTAATLGANPSCCAAANLRICKGIALEYLKRFFFDHSKPPLGLGFCYRNCSHILN
jgi:hypothetical protein